MGGGAPTAHALQRAPAAGDGPRYPVGRWASGRAGGGRWGKLRGVLDQSGDKRLPCSITACAHTRTLALNEKCTQSARWKG